MELESVLKSYRRYARRYDFYFGALLQPGRRAVIERMRCRAGDRILEVGVGTGLSLPLYPRAVRVTGVDISPEMLEVAAARARRNDLDHVTLRCVNGERLDFPDDSFDKAVAMYVVSVAPDPVRLLNEMRRVCRPQGEIFIVNHFHHTDSVMGGLERLTAPLAQLMGFHPDFSLEKFVRETRLEVAERTPVNLFGYWTLLRVQNSKSSTPAAGMRHPSHGTTDHVTG
jgi:phosphatidylethanolamine/phosphatidyl-N-methylethanolamine N-methyltransferase